MPRARRAAARYSAGFGPACSPSLTSGGFRTSRLHEPGSFRWNVEQLWGDIRRGLDAVSGGPLESVGVDAWGVDYALLGERGTLLENPYHYRDARTAGMMEAVFARVSRDEIYHTTGMQFLPINTLYQLHAATRSTPDILSHARTLLTMPDLFNYWLSGRLCTEYTIATTTQCLDARTRTWATDLLSRAGPDRDVPASRGTGDGASDGSRLPCRPRSPARRLWPPRVTTRHRPSPRFTPAAARRFSAPARGRCSGPSARRRCCPQRLAISTSPMKAACAAPSGC